MPINYDFDAYWDLIIVPLLNTKQVKNAIKKGILGYMNNCLNPDVKLKSYKNIFDYLNKIHGKYYLNINSSPSDYSTRCTEHQMEWENKLVDKLEDSGFIKHFEWDENEDDAITSDNYEKYREDYLCPLLKPYVNNYKKTHMDSYCLWGGCHWWNPTFCLTLAKLVLPNEIWRVRSSEYHTTVVNHDDSKIFDIVYYNNKDNSYGGDLAYENSGMDFSEILERNNKIKENFNSKTMIKMIKPMKQM